MKNKNVIKIYLVYSQFLDKYHVDEPPRNVDYHSNSINDPIRFSITVQSKSMVPVIYIDRNNWTRGVPRSKLLPNDYRRYVITHEFGHALGFDHQECSAKTSTYSPETNEWYCPVMYQSTRGCPNGIICGSKVSKFDFEKRISQAYYNINDYLKK